MTQQWRTPHVVRAFWHLPGFQFAVLCPDCLDNGPIFKYPRKSRDVLEQGEAVSKANLVIKVGCDESQGPLPGRLVDCRLNGKSIPNVVDIRFYADLDDAVICNLSFRPSAVDIAMPNVDGKTSKMVVDMLKEEVEGVEIFNDDTTHEERAHQRQLRRAIGRHARDLSPVMNAEEGAAMAKLVSTIKARLESDAPVQKTTTQSSGGFHEFENRS